MLGRPSDRCMVGSSARLQRGPNRKRCLQLVMCSVCTSGGLDGLKLSSLRIKSPIGSKETGLGM